MSAESHVYVNLRTSKVNLSLPRGARMELESNHAVQGEYFKRYCGSDTLVPLEGCPHGFKPAMVHNPLAIAASKNVGDSPVSITHPVVPPAHPLRHITAMPTMTPAAGGVVGPSKFLELTKEEWVAKLASETDEQILQTTRFEDLVKLGAFLLGKRPVQSTNKAETLNAIRSAIPANQEATEVPAQPAATEATASTETSTVTDA